MESLDIAVCRLFFGRRRVDSGVTKISESRIIGPPKGGPVAS
jgi:hypothetical protein